MVTYNHNYVEPAAKTVGDATKKDHIERLDINSKAHQERIESLLGKHEQVVIFNREITGSISEYPISDLVQLGTFKATQNLQINEVSIVLTSNPLSLTTSAEGVLQVTLEKSTDNGKTWANILQTALTIPEGENTLGKIFSVNDFISNQLLETNMLRFGVSLRKNAQGSFHVFVTSTIV